MALIKPIVVAAAVFTLGACGGGSSTPVNDDPGGDDRPGLVVEGLAAGDLDEAVSPFLVVIDLFRLESRTPGTGDASVFMRRYRADFPVSRHVDFYTPELEVCDIRDGGSGGGGGGSTAVYTDLGETLTINSGGSPWFVLNRSLNDDGQPVYRTDNELPGALPADATLSLPATDFPTLTAFPLVEPAIPVRLLPDADTDIARESAYSWIPDSSNATMVISLLAYDANGDFQGFKVRCEVIDDGSFTMPEDVLTFIDGSEDRLLARYTRQTNRVDVIDGVTIYQNSGVAE